MAVGKKTGGRQKGTPNKTTKEAREFALTHVREAIATGKSPLDVMLDNMNFAVNEAAELIKKMNVDKTTTADDFKELLRLRAMAQSFASDAAPYMHPRLAAVEHSGDLKLTHESALSELEAAANGHDGEANVVPN